jgi:hypothetical protein
MRDSTSYPWPTASRPCLCVGAARGLLVDRLGSGSSHLPSLVWMSSRTSLSHVLLCSRSAVTPSPRPGMLRSAPLRPDNPWSGMWGRCGPNSGAINDGLTLADPLSQGAQLYFRQPASSLERCDRPGKRHHEYELASRCRSGVPSSVLSLAKSKMRAMQGDPFLPTRGCGPRAIGHRKPCLNKERIPEREPLILRAQPGTPVETV